MDENALIQSAQKGDIDAFNTLVLTYQKRVYQQAYYLLGNTQLAEDITQDVFLSAFQKLSWFRGGSLRTWLLRIATNMCYDEMRRWKRHPSEPLEPINAEGEYIESPSWLADPQPSPEEIVINAMLREAIHRAMADLPANYRTAVILVDIQGLEYAEAAAIMGTSIGTLKSRLARGRMKLTVACRNPSMSLK